MRNLSRRLKNAKKGKDCDRCGSSGCCGRRYYAASGAGRGETQTPQIAVTKAETGDVEEIVDATGTVVSDEQKTFYSPVNAQIKSVSFAEGDTVSKGTKLIEFEVKDLERDNQKAELNVQSGQYDYKNSINKI